MFGGLGDDFMSGDNGNDYLDGSFGNDFLDGGNGSDVLIGGTGNDYLAGGNGADTLVGGTGNDILSGGAGSDILSGGAGQDIYVFHSGGGNDVIIDFQHGDDLLQIEANINGTGIQSAADVAAHAVAVGNNTLINLGNGDTVLLKGITLDEVQHDPNSFFSVG
jgi:Ca2+-binding RTX toxin-like protein